MAESSLTLLRERRGDHGPARLRRLRGVELISASASGDADLIVRVRQAWTILLPAIVSEQSLLYFREYLARQSQRYIKPTSVSE